MNAKRKESVSTRLINNGAKLFCADRNREYFLNETGLEIWKHLNGKNSAQFIAKQIADTFEIDDIQEVEHDVTAFILALSRDNWAVEGSSICAPAESFPLNSSAPTTFDISITGNCNLKCPFCFYSEPMKDRRDLPFEEWQTFFAELKSLAVRELALSGGEIFTRSDIFEVIDSLVSNRLRYSILSNGTLINETIVSKLLIPERLKRLNYVQVSVDGSKPSIHDKIRGDGSFNKTDTALRLMKEANVPLSSRITINKYNLNDLEATVAYLLDDIGMNNISTNAVVAMGEAKENSVALSAKERLVAINTMHRLSTEVWPGRLTAAAGPQYEYKLFEAFEKGEQFNSAYQGKLTACGCSFSKLAVHHDGVIVPCNMLYSFAMGYINKDKIANIWKNSEILQQLKDRRQISLKDIEFCANCEYVSICNGGCPGSEAERTGSLVTPNKESCYRLFKQQLELEK